LDQSHDIYAKLLGLPTGRRPPDYYALLGLKPNESDEARIHRAARRQIARLSNLLASDHAEPAQQLMAEIAMARAVLTTPAARERYEAKLRAEPDFVPRPVTTSASNADGLLPPSTENRVVAQAPQSSPPNLPAQEPASNADAALATPRWANPVEAPPRPPDSPVAAPTTAKARLVAGPGAAFNAAQPIHADELPPLPPAAHAPLPEAWHPGMESSGPAGFASSGVRRSPVTARRNNVARERSQLAMILVLLCVLAACGLAGGAMLVWQKSHPAVAATPQDGPATDTLKKSSPSTASAGGTKTRSKSDREESDPTGVLSDRGLASGNDRRTAEGERAMEEKSAEVAPRMPEKSMAEKPAMPRREPEMAKREPDTKATPAADDAGHAANVRQTLEKARNALALGELDKVDELLDLAMIDASTDRLRGDVEGVKTLRSCVGSFNNAIRESLKTVTSNTELEYGGDVIIVVEVSRDRDRLIVRMKGQNRDLRVQELPTDLATALATRWLDKNDVNSRAFVGAYLVSTARRDDVERGRTMLREAQAAGSDVARAVLEALAR
jgi:hypothetical protein